MKAILKGILVVLVTLILFAASVKAEGLDELLKGKIIVYVGVCWFDKDGTLTFDTTKKKQVIKCVVGMELPDQTKHYVLLYYNDKPSKLVMFDETTKKQVTLWSGNTV